MEKRWYQQKWAIVGMHAVAWILLFALPYLLRPSFNDSSKPVEHASQSTTNFILSRINDLFLIGFFYLNALVLFPKLLYRKQYALYFLSIITCFCLILCQFWFLHVLLEKPNPYFTFRKLLFFHFFIFIFILACSIAYRTIRDKMHADTLAREKENEFLKTELSLLRSQVSPHFMFNVLNNMVSLARKQSDQLEPSLIKLSSLMRYMLYDTGEEKVSLEKETEYLHSYIDLQQQRFGKKVQIETHFGEPDKLYFIEPMLLIPFVENAFKHGTGMIEEAVIRIHLAAANDQLSFSVQNKYNPQSQEIKDQASGIGLTNVARRLQLLYTKKHQLEIEQQDPFFTVNLRIQLSA